MLLGAIYEACTWAWPPVEVVDVINEYGQGLEEVARGRLVPPYVLGGLAVGFLSLGWYLWPVESEDQTEEVVVIEGE